jgi:hypothetical protein
MSHVLVSYKREDELRVSRLIRALQQHGLIIWWDQGLPGAEDWRKNIENALVQAGCVIVVWTEGSVGPDGGFVRDEASRAKARGVLVPVRLDKVDPPLGFGELQAIDLSHWKSNPNDPFLLDLVSVCRAKLDGVPAPAPKGPTQRLMRRAAAGSGGFALAALVLALAVNAFHIQDGLCRMPGVQPALSDACGALHLGDVPSRDERIAWQTRPAGSCDALRAHIARFPNGTYRTLAADLLQGARTSRVEVFTAATRPVRGYVRQSEQAFVSLSQAQDDARARALKDAEQIACASHDEFERTDSAVLDSVNFDCRAMQGGQVCAADYAATCRIEARPLVERCG